MRPLHSRLLTAGAISTLVSLAIADPPASPAPSRHAQPATGQSLPPANGPRRADPTWHALRNATVHTKPGETLAHATVVIKGDTIQAILPAEPGPDGKANTADDVPAPVPIGPRVWECDGLHIYAGFIDPYVEVETPAPDKTSPGLHWNSKVTPQRHATDGKGIADNAAKDLRALGFTAAAISPQGGVFRGQSAVVSLAAPNADISKARPPTYRDGVYQSVAFEIGGFGRLFRDDPNFDQATWPGYPSSEMGAIALIRQTLIDADWQAQARAAGADIPENAVDALGSPTSSSPLPTAHSPLPLLLNADDELECFRAAKVAAEFHRSMILLASGMEFRRLPAIIDAFSGSDSSSATSARHPSGSSPIIVPINFPRPPDVTSLGNVENVELRDMMTWEQAPTNPRRLDEAGLTVALTTAKLRNVSDFRKNLQRAMRYGLAPEHALAMVTTTPARILGVESVMGTIEPGKLANLVVADGDLFTPEKAPKKDKKDDKKDGDKKDDADKGGDKAKPGDDKPTDDGAFDEENRAGQPQPGQGGRGRGFRGGRGGGFGGRGGRGGGGGEGEEKIVQVRDVWVDGLRHEINAAPQPDITGTYDITSDPPPPAPKPSVLIIEKGDAVTIKSGDESSKAKSVSRVKSKLSFVFDNIGEPKGVNTVSAVVEGDTIYGTGVSPTGQTVTFKAVKQPPSAAIGTWRIIENDGAAVDAAAEKQLVITITGGASPKLSLDFTRVGGKHVIIDATDVKLEPKGASFGHSLKDLGVEATSKDTVTIDGDIMSGESTLSDESKHTYKAKREPASSSGTGMLPVSTSSITTIQGTYCITTIDDKPNAKAGSPPSAFIYVKSDNSVALKHGTQLITAEDVTVAGKTIKYSIDFAKMGGKGTVTSEATLSDDGKALNGSMVIPDGTTHTWTGQRRPGDPDTLAELPESNAMPFGPYAKDTMPAMPATVIIKNATIWTSAQKGTLKNGTLVIGGGKILAIGNNENDWGAAVPNDAKSIIIDATGKHITAGLIDCHSHTGISRGVNEGGQAVTAEVRIEDVTNPDAIAWYRELAGGVTSVNSLHGSANPIGGQNCINKVRWGVPHPDDMHFEGAKPGIKFALGENVKQSNGDRATTRYPSSRMGVESIMRDRFDAAREYISLRDAGGPSFHRDLELDALAEVLEGRRLVHCHSYRQDEILMLARLSREFGFKLGTYQHNLEGYKVADAVRDSSIGASLFSDWWGYKVEVQDAIPYAGTLMHDVGVVISFNSDSDELARRLNTEAAKAVRYGGLSEEEAIKFVTINPAKQLAIDARVGSLEPGKDADFVIWSAPPLSQLAVCESTWIDGREYFSLKQDKADQEHIAKERARLIQKILASGEAADDGGGGGGDFRPGDEIITTSGDCGCGFVHSGL